MMYVRNPAVGSLRQRHNTYQIVWRGEPDIGGVSFASRQEPKQKTLLGHPASNHLWGRFQLPRFDADPLLRFNLRFNLRLKGNYYTRH